MNPDVPPVASYPSDGEQVSIEQIRRKLSAAELALSQWMKRQDVQNLPDLALMPELIRAAADMLNRSDHLLEEVFNTIIASMAYLDCDLRIVRVNRSFAKAAGLPQDSFAGKDYFDLFPSAELQKLFRQVLETGQALTMKATRFQAGDEVSFWDWSLQPLFDAAAETQGLLMTAVNVTEEVRAQAQLEENQRLFQSLFNSAPDAMLVVDSTGKILRVNQLVTHRFGYNPDELIGKPIEKLIPEDFQKKHTRLRGEYQRSPITRPMGIGLSLFGRRKDGSQFPVDVNLSPVQVGAETQVICVVRDISARLQSEKAFRQQAAYVQLLQDIAAAANRSDSVEEVLQQALERICATVGWQMGHAILINENGALRSTGLWCASDHDKLHAFREISESLDFSTGGLPEVINRTRKAAWVDDVYALSEFRRKLQAREAGLVAWFSFPILVGQQEVVGVLEFFSSVYTEMNAAVLDTMENIGAQLGRVIERRRAGEALRRSEARFRAMFEKTPVGIQINDTEGNILDANPALQHILGYSSAELQTMSLAAISHPDDLENTLSLFKTLLSGSQQPDPIETRYIHRDGQVVWTELAGSPVFDGSGKLQFILILVRDISLLVQKTAELEEVQRKLLESSEMERISLARSLHDGPLQDLYGASYALQEFLGELQGVGDTTGANNANATMQRVIDRLRIICGELRPPSLNPFGLEKAIRSDVERLEAIYPNLRIHLDLMADRQTLSEQARLALFRIYQQLVANVIRHARADNLWVRFRLEDDMVILEVEDDGLGFVLPARWVDLAREGHAGLLGVLERVEVFGGTMEVERNRARGSRLWVRIPRQRINPSAAR